MDFKQVLIKLVLKLKKNMKQKLERITKYYLDRDIYLRTELDKAVSIW